MRKLRLGVRSGLEVLVDEMARLGVQGVDGARVRHVFGGFATAYGKDREVTLGRSRVDMKMITA